MAKNSCQKKPIFLEILGTKVVQFSSFTKLVKTINVLLNWYFPTKIFDFCCWKPTLKIRFWHFLTVIYGHLTSLMKKSMPYLWSVQLWLQSEMFFIKFCWHDEKLTTGALTEWHLTPQKSFKRSKKIRYLKNSLLLKYVWILISDWHTVWKMSRSSFKLIVVCSCIDFELVMKFLYNLCVGDQFFIQFFFLIEFIYILQTRSTTDKVMKRRIEIHRNDGRQISPSLQLFLCVSHFLLKHQL